jgi:hypothetical protein
MSPMFGPILSNVGNSRQGFLIVHSTKFRANKSSGSRAASYRYDEGQM